MNRFILAISVLLAGCSIGGRLAAQDAALKGRLAREAPGAWKAYLARTTRLQGSINWRIVDVKPTTGLVSDTRMEFKQRADSVIWIEQNRLLGYKKDTRGGVTGINPRYLFDLTRRDATAPWTIKRTLNLTNGTILEPLQDLRDVVYFRFPCQVTHALETQLPTMFKNPKFNLGNVMPLVKDGRTLVKVEFTSDDGELTTKRRHWVKDGWLLLDPELLWLMRAYEVRDLRWSGDGEVPQETVLAGRYDYQQAEDGFPLVTSHLQTRTRQNTVYRMEYEYNVTEADLPEEEFTLPAFGFPDPGFKAHRRTSWYVWFALAGFLALALGSFLRWRARRASQPELAR